MDLTTSLRDAFGTALWAADLLAGSGQVAVAEGLRAQAAVLRSHLG